MGVEGVTIKTERPFISRKKRNGGKLQNLNRVQSLGNLAVQISQFEFMVLKTHVENDLPGTIVCVRGGFSAGVGMERGGCANQAILAQ